MSETPTPSKGQSKRRGLALPPRGQALARLQDLEQDLEEESEQNVVPSEELRDDVAAEISNAVNHQGSTASIETQEPARAVRSRTSTPKASVQGSAILKPTPMAAGVAAIGYQVQARAVREPTTRITVDMPDSLHRKISMLAAETRRSIKDLVIDALATTYFAADQDPS